MMSLKPGLVVLAVALLVNVPCLQAQEVLVDGYRLDLELGLLRTDNPLGNSPRGPGDTLLVPRAEIDFHHPGGQWEARGSGYLEYRIGLENTVEDQFRANMAAVLDWTLVPGSLNWVAENVASVELIDFLTFESADNFQQINVLSTGPSWQIRPMSTWGALVDARYTFSYAEESEAFNTNRLSASGYLLYRYDANRRLSAGAEIADVQFRDGSFDEADYQRLDLIARYRSRGLRTELELTAGQTRIEPEQGPSLTSPLARVLWIWSDADRHSIRLLAMHELSDSTRHLRGEIDRIGQPATDVSRLPIGADIFRVSSIELGWFFLHARGDLSVRPIYRDFEYEFSPEDDFREVGAHLHGRWHVRPATSLVASLGGERRSFKLDQRRDTDLRATLFLERRFAPRWSGRAGLIRYQRNSNILGADSRETIAAVYLTFHAGR